MLCRSHRAFAVAVPFLALGPALLAGTDVKVNQDAALSIRQNETVVVVNPVYACPGGGLNVVAAYNDDPGDQLASGTSGLGISWSCDGGQTWTDTQTPVPPGYSATDPVADPSLAVDATGDVYAAFFTAQGSFFTGQSAVFVTVSTNGGQTWSVPTAADTRVWPGGMAPPVEFLDKCWLDVDRFTGSPWAGNVYVAYQADDPNGVKSDIWFARSTTGGASFSPAFRISDSTSSGYVGNAAMPAVGGNGNLYIGWHDSPVNSHQPARLYVDRSLDGGMSFGPDVLVTTYRRPPRWPGAGQDFMVRGFPSVAADPRPGVPSVYVAYAADPDATGETRLDTDAPGAAYSARVRLAQSGSNVHAVWQDGRNSGFNLDVYFNRSADGGATWAGSDVRLNTNTAGTSLSDEPEVAASGTNVYVVWQDTRNGSTDIYFNRSTDNGQTWLSSDVRLDTDTPGASPSQWPQVAAVGSNVYVVWAEYRGSPEIRFNRSTNNGASWLSNDVAINAGATGFTAPPQVSAQGSDVYVVWQDGFVKFNRSTDSGATWQGSDTQLDSAVGPTSGIPPRICSDANGVFVVYEDQTRPWPPNPLVFSNAVHFNYSTDGGANWLASDIQVDQGGSGLFSAGEPAIACAASHVYVAWSDGRLLGAGSDPIFRAFDRNAGSFGPEYYLATKTAGLTVGADLHLAADGNAVHVTWRDGRFGPFDTVSYQRSPDNGATWFGECAPYADQRLDVGSTPGTDAATTPRVLASSGTVLIAFESTLSGQNTDIRLVRSTNGGATFQDGPDDGDVFLVASHDGGTSWSVPVRVNEDATTRGQFQPRVRVKPNGTVDVVWLDRRADVNDVNFEIYTAASTDGGATFLPSAAVSDAPSVRVTQRSPACGSPANNWEWMGEYIGIDVDATDAFVTWTDTRQPGVGTPDMDIYFDRVANAGQAGQPDLRVASNGLTWAAVPSAVAYDVVRGKLEVLRSSGGNFTTATDACLVNNGSFAALAYTVDPAAGLGHWFLVRGVATGGNLSYDTGSASQIGFRDAEINTAAAACP